MCCGCQTALSWVYEKAARKRMIGAKESVRWRVDEKEGNVGKQRRTEEKLNDDEDGERTMKNERIRG